MYSAWHSRENTDSALRLWWVGSQICLQSAYVFQLADAVKVFDKKEKAL